ncbi:MAG: helix-turn-helix domain-containing protein [Candidatus Colwellbacteria bacterium]|nr:helix-turn-helix domain-containing protein [Candidatus Colwellbacteria bacterium]
MCVNFEGKLFKDGNFWPVYVSVLEICTQGRSKKDAYMMIKDAVEIHLEYNLKHKIKVVVMPMPNNKFILRASNEKNDKYLMALMLRRQREKYGLTVDKVARRLGVTKRTYAKYEQARSLPSLAQIEKYIRAMDNHAHVVLNILEEKEECF